MAHVVNRDKVAWRVVDDEAVVIHSETSEYFSLNRTGTWLWSLLEQPQTSTDLAAALSARYARPLDETGPDVTGYLEELTEAGLIVPAGEPEPRAVSAAPAGAAVPPDGYEPPQLVKFGNLETLILSGE